MENEIPERKEEQVQDVQTPAAEAAPSTTDVPHEERLWAMGCHLAALAGLMPVFPLLGLLLAPLILWLLKREGNPYLDSQGKEAVNFQISILIYLCVCIPLVLILIGIVLASALLVFDFVMIIVAAIKVNSGEDFRYPLCIRFIK